MNHSQKKYSKIQTEGLRIVKLLKQSGFEAFWVGGSVRDMFLNRPQDNLDIATSARPDQTEAVLDKAGYKTKPVGKAYGTILAITKYGPVEITTFRKEGEYLDRRHPNEISYITDYKQDSNRRDFTVNAMYFDPVKKKLLDPQNGQKDLERKLLKFVGDPKKRIDEDALRMMRAARLSMQLNFKIEKNSFAAIKTRAKFIQKISGERIKTELDKILLLPNKEQGVRLLDELGLLKFIMPEVTDLKKIWHKSKLYHLEGNVFEHSLLTLKNVPTGNTSLAYAALYHDAGKSTTAVPRKKEEGMVNSFPKHEFVSADLFKKLSDRLKFSKNERDLILWITKTHMTRIAFVKDMSEKKKLQLASHKYFPELLELWRSDSISNLRIVDGKSVPGTPKAYMEGTKLMKNIGAKKKLIENLVDWEMIMNETKINSGPRVGALKNLLEQKIFSGDVKNISDVKKFLKSMRKNT